MGSIAESQTRVIQGLVSRGIVTSSDATKMMQELRVDTLDAVGDTCEHFEPAGLTARPMDGAEALVLQVGGTSHPVAIDAGDRRYRPTDGAKGDTILYDSHGHKVHLSSAGLAVTGDVTSSGFVDGASFKVGGANGANGILNITIGAPAPVGTLSMVITKGIITTVAGTGACVWTEF